MRYLLIALTAFITCHVSAVTIYDNNCRNALSAIISLKPSDAKYSLQQEKTSNPSNLYIPYLENYLNFIQVVVTEEKNHLDNYNDNFEILVNKIKATTEITPYKKYMLAELFLQCSVVKAKFNERLTSAKYFLKSQQYISENIKKYPNFKPNLRISGILTLVNNSLPPLLRYFLPPTPSCSDGFADLELFSDFASKDSVQSLECHILISLALLQFNSNNDNALKYILKIDADANPLFRLAKTLILVRAGKSAEARNLLEKKTQSLNEIPIAFFNYLSGETALNTQQSTNGKLEQFLAEYKGCNYIKSAWLKLGWYYYLNGDQKKYEYCLKNLQAKGVDWVEADKQAVWEAANNTFPNKYLLKSRLLFDGGSYSNARIVLETNTAIASLKSDDQRLEYYYRLARIYHALNNYSKAILFYKYAFNQGKNKSNYFAANAALQLGNIALLTGNKKDARIYFKSCIAMKQTGYAASIHAKAQEGLRKCLVN